MATARQRVIPVRSKVVNSYIIQGQRCILVDAGMPGSEQHIFARMEEKGIKPSDISLIIITHGHQDHFGSLAALKEKTGAPVAVYKDDVEAVKTGTNPRLAPIGITGKIMAAVSRLMKIPEIKPVVPDIIIEDEMDLSPYGVAGKVVPTPGHTRGSLSIFMDGGCVLIGDLIFGGLIRRKAPRLPSFGCDKAEIQKSIKKVLNFNPKIIYAGHGGPFTVDAVRNKFSSWF